MIPTFAQSIGIHGWTLSFDLYWTFSRTALARTTSDQTKFCLYSVAGWGVPALLTLLLIALQLSLPPNSDLHPGMELGRCFLRTSNCH